VRDHRAERPAAELVAHPVAVGIRRVAARAGQLARAARDQRIALDADVQLQRLAAEVADAGERSLPAERLDHQILVDAADAGSVELAVRGGAQHAEVDTLAGETRLATAARIARLADELGALLLQVARHLERQSLNDAERD